ncbi:hypothetical protein, partial [Plasmodium yoelii yoelii]
RPSRRSPTRMSGRRISRGSASIEAIASSASRDSGTISPALTRGAARLNHSATGRSPKNSRSSPARQGVARRSWTINSCPASRSICFWRALLAQPGFS